MPFRLAIVGPPRSGKTTLAAVLNRVTNIHTVFGDAYIQESQSHFDALKEALDSEQWIFEHVEALQLLQRVDLKPTHVIFLIPENSNATWLIGNARRLDWVRECGAFHLRYSSTREALLGALDLLHEISVLPPLVRTYVVKVASRCNINCSYCYMFEGGVDKSWKSNPTFMSPATANMVASRIAEYARMKNDSRAIVVFHGGEPLALPVARFEELAATFMQHLGSLPGVKFGVQTNGTLLDDEYLEALERWRFGIGISIDGYDAASNADRVDFEGKSTYDEILRGLDRAVAYSKQAKSKPGVLCVINPSSSGAESYRFFRDRGVDRIDFLLRDKTWNNAPDSVESDRNARFLIDAFDAWLADDEKCAVPYFEGVIAGLIAAPESVDTLGLLPPSTIAISTSGEWESLDVLRVTYDGAWRTPYNVREHSVDTVARSEEFRTYIRNKYDLSEECLSCRHLLVCGGGHITHRYSTTAAFRNRSVHCSPILAFVDHVKSRLLEAASAPPS